MNSSSREERWIHPLCHLLEASRNGPFIALDDDSLLTIDEEGVKISRDDGRSWSPPISFLPGIKSGEPGSYYVLQAGSKTLVTVYLDFTTYRFNWDDEKGEPKDDCRLEIWAARSLDGGETWVDRQRILDGYNANFFGFIQTRSGRIVATVEHVASNPGRLVACSLFSDDEGKTWRRSNFIDLGGRGHHDGAMEPTVAQLSDGRLLMLIRTSLGRFWQAFSEDEGEYWRVIQPSRVDASNSPGFLLRLRSSHLVLVWNRLNPEGRVWEKSKPGPASEKPTSWHREELSIAFSQDDGENWTRPVVIARQRSGQLSYPYVFERRPGEIWVTVGFAFKKGWQEPLPLRLKLFEEEFLKAIRH